MDTVQALFESRVKPLSMTERLELMRLMMDDLADSAPRWVVDISDLWSEEDLRDLGAASLAYASSRALAGEDDAQTG